MVENPRKPMGKGEWDLTQLMNSVDNPQGPERTLSAFAAFTSNKHYAEIVRQLKKEDTRKLVDGVDQAIWTTDWRKSRNLALLRALGSVCSATGRLPRTTTLNGLEKCGDIAVASGGFTDTWRGRYRSKTVALKAFRTYPSQDLKEARKILWREVLVWKRLSHDHVLQFHGVDKTNFQLSLVYDWADHGNIMQHLDSNPRDSRPRLLREVAEGLHYLHLYGVVHGDLKGTNVLISRNGHARLSDYGLMPIQSNHAFMVAATPGVVGISRWLAPELIDPPRKKGYQQPPATEQADIFAFAMLCIEVFTGELPFGDVRHETAILMIVRGQRPEKPADAEDRLGLTPEMWKFIQKCWHQHPTKRPDINTVVSAWRGFDFHEKPCSATQHTESVYREKHHSRARRSPAKTSDRRRKNRFCGLF